MAGLLWFVILMPLLLQPKLTVTPSVIKENESVTLNSVLLQPKLTVTPPVIKENESVTLNCETPSSMFVTECYFINTLSGKLVRPVSSSCQLTLMGSELLTTNQKLSAEVKVKCYYTVKTGDLKSPSLHSDTSSVTIRQTFATINLSTKGSEKTAVETSGDITTETVTATINLSTKGSEKTAVDSLLLRDIIAE
ncbi:hypothetical protein PAMP_017407 [Pampus punctatissimus]